MQSPRMNLFQSYVSLNFVSEWWRGCDHPHSGDVITHILWMWSLTFCGCDHPHSGDVITHILWMWSLTFCGCDHSHSVTKFLLLMFEYLYVIAWTQMLLLQWLITHLPHTLQQARDTIPCIDYQTSTHIAASSDTTQFLELITHLPHTLRQARDTIPCIDYQTSTHIAGSLDTTQFPVLITHLPHT